MMVNLSIQADEDIQSTLSFFQKVPPYNFEEAFIVIHYLSDPLIFVFRWMQGMVAWKYWGVEASHFPF